MQGKQIFKKSWKIYKKECLLQANNETRVYEKVSKIQKKQKKVSRKNDTIKDSDTERIKVILSF